MMTHRRHTLGVMGLVALAISTLPLLLTAGASAATSQASNSFCFFGFGCGPSTPPLPSLSLIPLATGHGYPYDFVPQAPLIPGAPYFNLQQLGYVQNEYLMKGTTNVYQQNGIWGSNGDWGVSVAQANVPYTTRMLVRYPTDPSKFNGTVIVEWSNVITGGDQDPVWSEIDNEVLQNGFAYALVTAQSPGMNDLKAWDTARYGTLGDSNDGQSYDIFTEAAEALRANTGGVLGNLHVNKVIGAGDSQSAFRTDTYVNAFQPLFHAFDAFMAVGRAGLAAPVTTGTFGTTFPAYVRTDNTAPFIQIDTQGDILELDAATSRQPDNADLRTWEIAGATHIDVHEATYELATIAVEEPTLAVPACTLGTPISGTGTPLDGINQVNNMPVYEVEDAAVQDLQRWLVSGTPAPSESSTLSANPLLFGFFYLPSTNQFGISSGGIQLPEAQLPAEDYGQLNLGSVNINPQDPQAIMTELESIFSTLENSTFPANNATLRTQGLCMLSGYFYNLGQSQLKSLYPTTADYAWRYAAAADALVSEGFMTQADATAAIVAAFAGQGPTQQPPETIP
jgi:hypothetical protein